MTRLKEVFTKEFPTYKERIDNFTTSTHFYLKSKEYENILITVSALQANGINNKDKSPAELINTINESYILIKEIVKLNRGLEAIFKMNEDALGTFCDYDFKEIDKRVTQDLTKLADLVEKFDNVSQKSREVFESIGNTFISKST